MRQIRERAAVMAALVLCLSCDGVDPTAVGPPATLSIVAGEGQTGTAGAKLASPLVVKVEDAAGHGVSGQIVNFKVVAGGGEVFAGASLTNADGQAQELWTLGKSVADSQRIEVRAVDPATGAALVFATFRATAVAGPAASIQKAGGDSGQAVAGATVAAVPSVRVADQFDNPVSGVTVTFAVASGGGSLTGGTRTTNALGIASVGSWTLGDVGTNTISATAGGVVGSGMVFSATAARGAYKLITGTASVGTAATITAQVVDQSGNAVAIGGRTVTWTRESGASGTFSSPTAQTDASGKAVVSFTPDQTFTSSQVEIRAADNLGAGGAAFLTVTTGPGAKLRFKTAIPSWGWRTIAQLVEVIITDQYSNPVSSTASVALSLANNPGGATLSGGSSTAAVGGVATFSALMLSAPGTGYTLTATDPSGVIAPATSTAFTVDAIASVVAGHTSLVVTGGNIYYAHFISLQQAVALEKVAVTGVGATRIGSVDFAYQAGRMLSDGTNIVTMNTAGVNTRSASIRRVSIATPHQASSLPLGSLASQHGGGWNMEFDGTYFYAQFVNNCFELSCTGPYKDVIARIHPVDGPTVLVNENQPFTVSGGYLYYASGTTIQRMPTAGGSATTVVSGIGTVVSAGWRTIIVVGNTLYWTETNGTIRSAPIDGSGSATTRVSGRTSAMKSMVSDGTYLYVNDSGSLRRFDLASFTVKTIVEDDGVWDIALDSEAVYWTSTNPNLRIKKTAK